MTSRRSWCYLFFISLPFIIDARTIWDEITIEDYPFDRVKVKPHTKNEPVPVECYHRIHRNGYNHTFKVNFAPLLDFGNREPCLIALPAPVKIEYGEVNFHNHSTFARVIIGNDRGRPALKSDTITNNADKPNESLDAVCAYAYLVVVFPSINDTLTFKLSRFEDDYALYDFDYSPCDF